MSAVYHSTLENGMDIVVIPDHRAPIVTHMVWYRNGAADDPLGKSGIAHFLEHLMFKGTDSHKQGEFSNRVAAVGGRENAFTSYDFTAYFQTVEKSHLPEMMAFESDRMTNIVLSDEVVNPERDVVLEERRMFYDANPQSLFYETMAATFYQRHPYGLPIIGYEAEIKGLGLEDALSYYRRFYTPENAILVIAGDIEGKALHELAEKTYGKVKARGAKPVRQRPQEPPPVAGRLVTMSNDKIKQPLFAQMTLVPSYNGADGREAAALDYLSNILGGGQTSRLYKSLVFDKGEALNASASYYGTAVDATSLHIHVTPTPGTEFEAIGKSVADCIARIASGDISDEEMTRSKTQQLAEFVYVQDDSATHARYYGTAMTTGMSVADVQNWPARIEAVTKEDVANVAKAYLKPERTVTGYMIPA